MPIYLVLGRDAAGKSRTAKIKADSPDHARARAAANGITAETVAVDTEDPSAITPAPAAAPVVAEKPATRVQPYAPRLEQGHQAGAPVMNIATPRRGSSLGIASIILGVLAFFICWIPLVNIISLPLSGLGLVLGIAGLVVAMTRGGSSIGLPIAGGAVSLLALVVAGLMWLAIASPAINRARQSAATAAGGSAAVTIAPAPVRVGDFSLEVLSAQVGKVRIVDSISERSGESNDELVRIELRLTNTSTTRKHDVLTFGVRSGLLLLNDPSATLTDNFGNGYTAGRFGSSYRVDGHSNIYAIHPGESAVDVLVFERPVKNIEHLDLVLDTENIQVHGQTTIRIPASMIKR